jgi:S-DNA-T family DNA segregation ATPase FtsK/SpoIIIE
VLTIGGALARAFSPGELHLYAVGSRALSALTVLPHTAAFASVDDGEHVALVIDAVRAEVTRRTRDPSLGRFARVVLLVDGWESLANLDNGSLAAQLRLLLDAGQSARLSAVLTGGRAVLAGQLTSVLSQRLVLRLGDAVDLALAGIPAPSVPVHQPPGRAIEVATLREVQLGQVAPDASSTAAALEVIAQEWSTESDVGLPPRSVRRLPQDVPLSECRAAPGTVAVGVREGDLAVRGFSPAVGERRLVVVGPPRSGRSTVLATLAIGLAGIGLPVAVVGDALDERTHAHTVLAVSGRETTERDRLVEARRAHANLAVVIDDAERLADTAIEAVLLEIARLVDEDGGVVVAATTAHGLESRASLLTTELARARTGVLLNPAHGSHLLGLSVQTASPLHPGRGWLVTPRGRERVQVAQPP